jgi:hypothetical protein
MKKKQNTITKGVKMVVNRPDLLTQCRYIYTSSEEKSIVPREILEHKKTEVVVNYNKHKYNTGANHQLTAKDGRCQSSTNHQLTPCKALALH